MLISLTLRVSKNTFFGLVFLPEANLEGRGAPPLYITPSHLLQLVRGDVEARNPMDRKQLLSPPQAMDQLFFPPQKRDQLFPHPKDRHHLLSPPKYRDQILSPPKDRHHLLSPPTLRGKRAGLWVPRWVKKVREDITQKQGEIIK